MAQGESHYLNLQRFNDLQHPDFSSTEKHLTCYTSDDFEQAFSKRASRDGKIAIDDIPSVVRETMCDDAAEWIVKKFVVLGRRRSLFKQITWEDFK